MSGLDLQGCENITEIGISALGQSCPLLSSISLPHCNKVTDIGISALGVGCPLYSNIDLTGCNNITDVDISRLAETRRGLLFVKMDQSLLMQ